MKSRWMQNAVTVLLIALLILSTFFHLLRRIDDPDFFWHLKTGEWIWQNRTLPTEDPFAFTSSVSHSPRERFYLTSYWVSQVIFYQVYRLGSMSGIVVLRFAVAGLLFLVMIRRRQGDRTLYFGLLILFFTVLLEEYPIERPHVFSFLFFAVLLHLLEGLKAGENASYLSVYQPCPSAKKYPLVQIFLLPVVMLVWANMHGGYILGQTTIFIYIVMEGVKFLSPSCRPITKEAYMRLLIAGILGIIFSLINPNTYHPFPVVMSIPAFVKSGNLEYKSSWEIFSNYNSYTMLLYWFILLLTIIGVMTDFIKKNITEIVLLFGIGWFSFFEIRYIIFFMIIALPFIARVYSRAAALKWSRIIITAAALGSVVLFSWDERLNIDNIVSGKWISNYSFPAEAAQFIVDHDLSGNMYNHYNWGGYLIWRLAPERRVFIDGRTIDPDLLRTAQRISNAYTGNSNWPPFWKSALNEYKVQYVIIPFFTSSGEILPLFYVLLNDISWKPVFYYLNSIILVRDIPENFQVIKEHSLQKGQLIDGLLAVCDILIKANPENIPAYIARGDLYMVEARYKEAKGAYERVIKIAPFNSVARGRLALIKANNMY